MIVISIVIVTVIAIAIAIVNVKVKAKEIVRLRVVVRIVIVIVIAIAIVKILMVIVAPSLCLHYILSEGAPIWERVGQENERYGSGSMLSRPPQTAHHQEKPHAVLDYLGASVPIVVWKPWEELGAKLVQFRWLLELARAPYKSWTRVGKTSPRRNKPTMAWENEDIQRAVLIEYSWTPK